MEPHQERVIAEKADLDVKIGKLESFTCGEVYPTLDREEQMRLFRQLLYMKSYSGVLAERIAAF